MKRLDFNTITKLAKIGFGVYLVLFLSACGHRSNKNEDDNQFSTEKVDIRKQAEQYFEHVKDSVLRTNGYYNYAEQDKNRSYYDDYSTIYDLEYEYTLGGAIEKQVSNATEKVFNQGLQEISDELAKYKIKLDLPMYCFNYQDCIEMIAQNKDVEYGPSFFYGIVDSTEDKYLYDELAWEWEKFQNNINDIIDNSNYGPGPKKDMKTNVAKIIKKTQISLKNTRETIEKQFEDYYLPGYYKGTPYKPGLSYDNEGNARLTYDEIEAHKYLVTKNVIHVYDSKLPVDFFGDKNSKYTLVSLGNNKWQVIKENKSGKIEKSAVFTDKKTFQEYKFGTDDKPTKGQSEFDFYPGTNMGVHINYSTISNVETRKKDWEVKIPENVQQQIDSLRQEITRKRAISDSVDKKIDEAYDIAKLKTIERFGKEY